jgi:Fic family protein
MKPEMFSSRSPGRLVKNLENLPTYAPNPLYPTESVKPSAALLEEVIAALARLDGIAQGLPDPTILIRSFVRREAQLSSYIENTFAKYEEVAEAARTHKRVTSSAQITETLNAEKAILAGVDAVVHRHRPVSNALIRQLHEVLMTGVRGHECRG